MPPREEWRTSAERAIGRHTVTLVDEPALPVMSLARQIALNAELKNDDGAYYIFDVSSVIDQFDKWTSALGRVRPYYAVKCNGDALMIRTLAALGCGFDCASKAEIEATLPHVESATDDIVYANPCKTRNYIRHAAAVGVDLMTFDGCDELRKVQRTAPDARLLLRINIADKTAQCPLSIKFGCCPTAEAPRLLRTAAELGVRVVGISFHVGSGCRDGGDAYRRAIGHARALFTIAAELGHSMSVLDIGGGFPGHDDGNTPFEVLATAINEAIDEHFDDVEGVRLMAEPGRFFASSAFTLTTNIMARTRKAANDITKDVKHASEHGYMYYLNDGVYGSFNCLLYDHSTVEAEVLFEERADMGDVMWSSLWGPTCDGLDLIAAKCRMPRLSDGDWLTFGNMGAYTLAAGSTFNGFPRPSVHYFARGEHGDRLPSLAVDETESSGIESLADSDHE